MSRLLHNALLLPFLLMSFMGSSSDAARADPQTDRVKPRLSASLGYTRTWFPRQEVTTRPDADSHLSPSFGLTITFPSSGWLGLQLGGAVQHRDAELQQTVLIGGYLDEDTRSEYRETEYDLTYLSLSTGLIFRARPMRRFRPYLVAGYEVAFLLDAEAHLTKYQEQQSFHSVWDPGQSNAVDIPAVRLAIGGEVEAKPLSFYVEVSYAHGLADFIDSRRTPTGTPEVGIGSVQMRVLGLSVGVIL